MPWLIAVDRDNNYLFASTVDSVGRWELKVYSVNPSPKTVARSRAQSLLNVSTRLRAQPGDNALIGGFIIKGVEPKQIALRALGPSLPVPGQLADPVLELYDSSGGLIAQNDNWNADRFGVVATGIPHSER